MNLVVQGTSSHGERAQEPAQLAFNKYRRALLEAKRNSHQIREQADQMSIASTSEQYQHSLQVSNYQTEAGEPHRRLKSQDTMTADLVTLKPGM